MICPDEILHVDSLVFSVKQNVTAQYLISRFCPLAGVPLIHLVLGLVIKAEISIPLLKIMLRRTCRACKGPGNGDIHDTAAAAAAGDRRWKFDLSDRLMERWQRFFKSPCDGKLKQSFFLSPVQEMLLVNPPQDGFVSQIFADFKFQNFLYIIFSRKVQARL